MEEQDQQPSKLKIAKTLISFWMFGLCNNLGYVVMLSAAHDFMKEMDDDVNVEVLKKDYRRMCNVHSTGAILLADIVPSILVKFVVPFLPLVIHIRMFFAVLLSAVGFILVALRWRKWLILLGVVCTSASSGLGESSLLAYMAFFKTRNVISTWSSGTGAAGVFGSFIYAGMIAIGITPMITLLIMLVSPACMAFCFWVLVDHPKISKTQEILDVDRATSIDKRTLKEKLKLIPHLLFVYSAPFGLVYFFEYLINQGLFELMYFPNSFMDHHSQYRWYQFMYQCGVFISRSSMNIVHINYLWALAIVQGVNLTVISLEVTFGFMRYLLIGLFYIFWEGLIGGTSYVNTYRRIATEIHPSEREFSMAMNSFGDSVMITFAGFCALPLHEYLCTTSPPYKYNVTTAS